MNYTDRPSGFCPDDLARERELNTPREIDEDTPRFRFIHVPVTLEQLRKVIEGEKP